MKSKKKKKKKKKNAYSQTPTPWFCARREDVRPSNFQESVCDSTTCSAASIWAWYAKPVFRLQFKRLTPQRQPLKRRQRRNNNSKLLAIGAGGMSTLCIHKYSDFSQNFLSDTFIYCFFFTLNFFLYTCKIDKKPTSCYFLSLYFVLILLDNAKNNNGRYKWINK